MMIATSSHQFYIHRFQRFAYFASLLVTAIGACAFTGWLLNVDVLKSLIPGLATMKANTALCFIFLGYASYLQIAHPQYKRLFQISLLIAELIGTVSLIEYLFHFNTGIDELLFQDIANIHTSQYPGRMSYVTAIYISGMGVALWLLSLRSYKYVLMAQVIGLAGILLGLSALLGYSYGMKQMYEVLAYSSVSIYTCASFLLFGFAILCARPAEGFMEVITNTHYGGIVARKVLPFALVSPFVIGWLRLYGEKNEIYENEFGAAIGATANMLVFALLVWFSARRLNVIDARRLKTENHLRDSEQKLRKVIDGLGSNSLVALLTPEGILLEANQPSLVVAGVKLNDVIGISMDKTPWFAYSTAVQEQLSTNIALGANGVASRYDSQISATEGNLVWVDLTINPVCSDDDHVIYLVISATIIDERKRAEQELRIAAVAFESDEGIAITDANKLILRTNKSFTKITGYSAEEAVRQQYPISHSEKHDGKIYDEIWDALIRKYHWYGEVWNCRKNGEVYPEWLNITAVTNMKNEVTNYVIAFDDITLRKASEEKIELLAFYDPLTGMPNRRLLQDRLQQSFSASARHNNHGALLFIDLDNFKLLNDSKGHNFGDLLLVEVAARLQTCVRKVDTAARLGGDEFVILLGDLGDEQEQAAAAMEAISEKILNTLSKPYMLKEYEYHGSASIGIYLFSRNDDINVEEALKFADSAMYLAKNAGRNTMRFYDPTMQKILDARLALEADLRHAISESQFEVHYQIQVTNNDDIIGAEALIRWNHPKFGLVSPLEFIPLAEQTGLIIPIGNWALEKVCAQLRYWEESAETNKLQLALNVSAHQFYQLDFVKHVCKMLHKYKVKPGMLKLELTESTILDNVNDTIVKMTELRKLGVRFSLDDFGTGYSSLSYLTQLPLDQLKIDKSFIFHIGSKSSDAIVQTIIDMASNLEMEVIAEGVETLSQRLFLEENGCLLYQGYLFGKPLPLKEFEATLKFI